MRAPPWPEERIERLRELAPFYTNKEIGEKLGVSLNAVAGMARKLDLPRKPRVIGPDAGTNPRVLVARVPRVRTRRAGASPKVPSLTNMQPIAPRLVRLPTPPIIRQPAKLARHRPGGTCCFVVDNTPKRQRWCDAELDPHFEAYCPAHYRLCHTRVAA